MFAFLFPFSTLLVNIFQADHLVRFFNDHPLDIHLYIDMWIEKGGWKLEISLAMFY